MTWKLLMAKELLWLFCILVAVIAFWLLATFIMGKGLHLYYLQGLWGNNNSMNIREARLMTGIPVLVIYGIHIIVSAVRQRHKEQ
jgi:hypothetical protein